MEIKLDAERGAGRQGSKVTTEALKEFLGENKGLITSSAAQILGMTSITLAPLTAADPLATAVAGPLLSLSWLSVLKDKGKDEAKIKIELLEKQLELEKVAMELKTQIAKKEYELELVESQISKLNDIVSELT